MDPNANLAEQETILQAIHTSRSDRRRRQLQRQLNELRQALYDWIRDGGFEPDWSKAPEAAKYYDRPVIDFAAFRWCQVCGTQHHPDNTTCDGLRGGTTDSLAAAPAAAESGAPGAIVKALQVLVLDPKTRGYLREQDPKALQQACKALHDVGERYLVFGEAPTVSDLCWYCLLPLTTIRDGATFCRECRHTGQAVQPQLPAPVFEVLVGNVGSVYQGTDEQDALSTFNVYVEQSKYRSGRAAGEAVTLMRDGEPTKEYAPAAAGDDDQE